MIGLVHHGFDAALLPADDDECAGLPAQLLLAKGAHVMLRRNIDTADGLVNGAQGVVKDIIFSADNTMPDTVLVKFKNDVGKGNSINVENECLVPIRPLTAEFYGKKGTVIQRKQIPLILSYAVTVHKTQGLTMDKCVVDCGASVFDCGMAYVAMSRVTALSGLYLYSYDRAKVMVSECVINEMNRLREQ